MQAPPGIFLFFTSQRFLRSARARLFLGLRQPLLLVTRLATSTGELCAQPAHGTSDRVRQMSASQPVLLFASVLQYASLGARPRQLFSVDLAPERNTASQ